MTEPEDIPPFRYTAALAGRLGLAHDPRRSVVTSDASYYRWTQWIFLQIFNAWYDRDTGRAAPFPSWSRSSTPTSVSRPRAPTPSAGAGRS